MTPDQALATLNRQLDAHGETVVLQRLSTGQVPQTVVASVTARAVVRPLGVGQQKNQLVGSISQLDVMVIMSPREIESAGWVSGSTMGLDPRVPIKGNRIVIAGQARNIEAAHGIFVAGALVRIEIQARG